VADSPYHAFKSLKWKMSQKDLILEMKDKKINFQKELVESLMLKNFHLSQELAMSDHTTLELQQKTIENQKTKLQQQKVHILKLQNEISNLNQKLESAQEKLEEHCTKSYLQQKTLTEIKTEIETQDNCCVKRRDFGSKSSQNLVFLQFFCFKP
jgi:hypothetical protein